MYRFVFKQYRCHRYEFDDSTVTKVDPALVMNSEAYVLFYR